LELASGLERWDRGEKRGMIFSNFTPFKLTSSAVTVRQYLEDVRKSS